MDTGQGIYGVRDDIFCTWTWNIAAENTNCINTAKISILSNYFVASQGREQKVVVAVKCSDDFF